MVILSLFDSTILLVNIALKQKVDCLAVTYFFFKLQKFVTEHDLKVKNSTLEE